MQSGSGHGNCGPNSSTAGFVDATIMLFFFFDGFITGGILLILLSSIFGTFSTIFCGVEFEPAKVREMFELFLRFSNLS